jgi:hypothetical protein
MQLVVEMRWVGLRTVATMSAINHYEKRFSPLIRAYSLLTGSSPGPPFLLT